MKSEQINLPDTLSQKIALLDSLYRIAIVNLTNTDTNQTLFLLEEANTIISDLSEDEVSILNEVPSYIDIAKQITALKLRLPASAFSYTIGDSLDESDIQSVREAITAIEDDSSSVESDNVSETIENGYTIPVTMNRKVQNTIDYFTKRERGRRILKIWFERGSRYKKLIESILEEEGLPKDLFYLGMIESGYNPRARSWAAAVGPWQFISSTGRAYGLESSYWADDRRDVENATRAAARHLKDLYNRFGDWYLAMAGYNCNPAKIARRVRQQNTTDYFQLKYLPRETRGYVPNFIAAMIIGHNPEKYGIEYEEQEPLEYDRIHIRDVIDLNHIATASDTDFETIRDLNPAIYRWVTPSDRDSMYINVPVGTGDAVLAYIDSLPDSHKQKFIRYRIKSGDALSLISRKFDVRIETIRRLNPTEVHGNLINAGHYLMIPQPMDSKYYQEMRRVASVERSSKPKRSSSTRRTYNTSDRKKVVYTVKSGDTLGHIAEDYKTRAQYIRNWNDLYYGQAIRVGQKLTIWVRDGVTVERVPRGDDDLETDKYDYHKVLYGETLSTIAAKYNTDIDTIKQLNGLKGNMIKRGSNLIIREKGSL
ncbi:MAG: LysM peptidoglycan-binding domain-containing protein [Calditrichaeota bacterium]|nr:LysM peptidoglycan-binding domain-containing protein [Calditrichota bacterium]